MIVIGPNYVTQSEAARRLGCSQSRVQTMVKTGIIGTEARRTLGTGRKYPIIPLAALEAYIAAGKPGLRRRKVARPKASKPQGLSPVEVSRRLGYSPQTIRRWIDAGALPATIHGEKRERRVKPEDLDAFVRLHDMEDAPSRRGARP